MTLFSLKFICFRSFGCHGVRLKSSEPVRYARLLRASTNLFARWKIEEGEGEFERANWLVCSEIFVRLIICETVETV